MKLTITGKRLDTQAFANVLSQGEKGVEYVEIAADRFYEGTDLAALTWEMWGTYTRYESTAELAVPCVADGDDKVTFTWQPNEFYTIYPGPEELTLVGSDADGNKILKIVGTTPILVRENERKTSSIIIPAQVSNIEQAVNQCTQSATAAASSAGAAATSAAAAQTAQTAAEAAQATAETEAAAAAASAAQALQISQQNKGWYPSAEALTAAHPTGQNGDWALVGGDIDTIWMWDSDGAAWKNTNQQIDLSNYYTKTQADTQFATAAQGDKADILKAGLVYSTAEVETGEVGPTGAKYYRRSFYGTLPTITSDFDQIVIAVTGFSRGRGITADVLSSTSGDIQPHGYPFYLASPTDKQWSIFVLVSNSNIILHYGKNLGGKPYQIKFTYEK